METESVSDQQILNFNGFGLGARKNHHGDVDISKQK